MNSENKKIPARETPDGNMFIKEPRTYASSAKYLMVRTIWLV